MSGGFTRPIEIRRYPVALTTESLALGWARSEAAPEGAVVIADQELAPRQRKGPPWVAFPGNGLYASIVLRPQLPPEGEDLIWILASVAAANALRSLGVEAVLKWPDDVMVGDRKIAGVKAVAQLGPGCIESAVLTFRMNLDVEKGELPEELREVATSALIEQGRQVAPDEALDAVWSALDAAYDSGAPALLEDYRALCGTFGRSVRAHLLPRGEMVGTARDVDPFGALLIDTGGRNAVLNVGTLKRLEYLIASSG